jgi:ZIP family zinc transporter
VDAAAPFFGAIVGSLISISDENLAYLLALYAGFFLYVGASDLLPAAHARTSPLRVALTLAGFAVTYGIVTLASQ